MKKLIEKAKTIILVISGGIGRNIFATAVVRNLKKTYPEKNIIVVAGYADIFLNNPNIKRTYQFDKAVYLFEDFIFQQPDTIVLDVEPYRHPEYVSGTKHIVEAWCDLLDIDCDNTIGEMFFTETELEMGKLYVENNKKPMVLIQHVGGVDPKSCTKDNRVVSTNSMYRRSIPENVVQELTDKLIADGFRVGSIQTPNQFCPANAERINFPPRAIIGMIPFVSGIICIDSFLMHAAAVLDKKALVLWGGTSPDKLGYSLHNNLRRKVCSTPECHRPNSYLFDIRNNGFLWDCPSSDKCMKYTSTEILDAFKIMLGDKYHQVIVEDNKEECKGGCKASK